MFHTLLNSNFLSRNLEEVNLKPLKSRGAKLDIETLKEAKIKGSKIGDFRPKDRKLNGAEIRGRGKLKE